MAIVDTGKELRTSQRIKEKAKKTDQSNPGTLHSRSDFLAEHLGKKKPPSTKPSPHKKKSTAAKKKKTKNKDMPPHADEIQVVDPSPDHHLPQIGFVENVDFIRLEDSDGEPKGKTPNTDKGRPRGTKRKFDASTITEEQASTIRRKKGSIITPWFDKLSWRRRNVQQMLTAEIGSFVGYIQPTREEHQLREMIIEMIRKTIQSRWPDADVEPFGSFGSKLYLPVGDIDLVIISPQMMNQHKSKILYKLAPLIRENNIGQDVTVIAKAKVPIIKFRTIHGNINVDISINQTNGLVSLKKVNELLDDVKKLSNGHLDRRDDRGHHSSSHEDSIRQVVRDLGAAKCLVLVIKSVLKQRGMNEVYTGGLGSYSIVCLVVSFLQLHPKIQRGDIDPNKNLGVLLLEFFELYGKHFNFDETGISVRRGGYYFSKAHRGWQRERQPYLLSIEDPADENNDISSNSHNILSVRTVFSGAFDLLSATLYHRHSLQSSRSGAPDKFSSPRPLLSVPMPKSKSTEEELQKITKDPMDESLLGEIMGVTKELVEHRKKNIKLFYSGTLQRLLHMSPPKPAGSNDKLPSLMNGSPSREDYRNEHGSDSIRPDSSRHDPGTSRGYSPEEARRKSRQADQSESSRKHLSTKDSIRQATDRKVVRYDDVDVGTPCPPKKTDSERKKKRKGCKGSDPQSPHPLWVEDLEPSEVQILKRNLFSTDALNDPVPTVECTNEARVNTTDDPLDVSIRPSADDGHSDSEGHSADVQNSLKGNNDPAEHDEQMDSKYRSIHRSRVNQIALNFDDDKTLASSSPSASSKPAILAAQLYVEDEEDSDSDQSSSEAPANATPNLVRKGPGVHGLQNVPEYLPGTPDGSPGSPVQKSVDENGKTHGLLPGTPPDPPASSPPHPSIPTNPSDSSARLDSLSKQNLWLSKAFQFPPGHSHNDDPHFHPA